MSKASSIGGSGAVEGNIQHRAAHRGHPAINRSCLFHRVPTTLDLKIASATQADQLGARLIGSVRVGTLKTRDARGTGL
jgi:hypothetical protein